MPAAAAMPPAPLTRGLDQDGALGVLVASFAVVLLKLGQAVPGAGDAAARAALARVASAAAAAAAAGALLAGAKHLLRGMVVHALLAAAQHLRSNVGQQQL